MSWFIYSTFQVTSSFSPRFEVLRLLPPSIRTEGRTSKFKAPLYSQVFWAYLPIWCPMREWIVVSPSHEILWTHAIWTHLTPPFCCSMNEDPVIGILFAVLEVANEQLWLRWLRWSYHLWLGWCFGRITYFILIHCYSLKTSAQLSLSNHIMVFFFLVLGFHKIHKFQIPWWKHTMEDIWFRKMILGVWLDSFIMNTFSMRKVPCIFFPIKLGGNENIFFIIRKGKEKLLSEE